jgi:hypothetical protein
MRMVIVGLGLLAAAGCAMQPSQAGPWPPLPQPGAVQPAQEVAAAPAPQQAPMPTPVVAAAPALEVPRSLLPAWPEGWRAPTDDELNGPNTVRRGDSPSAYLAAEGDFNGDGRRDRAQLLVSETRDQYGVFVFDGRDSPYPVLVGGPAIAVEQLGLAPGQAGRIAFFVFGSSAFEIMWDGSVYAVAVSAD